MFARQVVGMVEGLYLRKGIRRLSGMPDYCAAIDATPGDDEDVAEVAAGWERSRLASAVTATGAVACSGWCSTGGSIAPRCTVGSTTWVKVEIRGWHGCRLDSRGRRGRGL